MSKLRIAVVFGGASSEHEVSLLSTASVVANLSPDKYDIYPIYISKEGEWFYYPGSIEDITWNDFADNKQLLPAIISPDRLVKGIVVSPVGQHPYTIKIDVVFPVLHGRYGEDGTIQGLFELAKLPYVGANVISSAMCMDKEIANRLFEYAGIAHTPWDVLYQEDRDRLDSYINRWEQSFGYPMFTKPANAGSSVGVSKASDKISLREGIDIAFLHDSKVIIEKGVVGRELECAVLGNNHPIASVLSEIIPLNELYDYDAKYTTPSKTVLPAVIDNDLSDEIRSTAVKAYRALGCSGMARVDFLYEISTKTIYINEINTIPGFTSISMYARMMDASGVNYEQLIDKLIVLAMKSENQTGGETYA
jgi:D-alanine-D-alanine ligase